MSIYALNGVDDTQWLMSADLSTEKHNGMPGNDPGTARESWQALRFFLFAAFSLSLTFSLMAYVGSISIVSPGPETAIRETTRSLWELGSFQAPYFYQVFEESRAISLRSHADIWQDVFAVDLDGRLVPKHSVISSIAALPFFALFGDAGFWVLQQLIFLWLAYSTFRIVESLAGGPLPWSTLLAVTMLSQTLWYTHNFSYDLHGCALIIGGLWLMKMRPVLGGILLGLSILVRPTHVLLVLPLILFSRASRARACTGAGVSILGIMAINSYWFGNPFSFSYEHLPIFRDGRMIISPHPAGFDLSTFVSRWGDKLWSSCGLLPYNLAFLALPWVAWWVVRGASAAPVRRELRLYASLALGYCLYFASYPMWYATADGNRFIFPGLYLFLIVFAVWLGQIERIITRQAKPAGGVTFPTPGQSSEL